MLGRAWLFALACAASAATPTPEELSARYNPSIFVPCAGFFDERGASKQACGSAFVIDPRGYLITNSHVVVNAYMPVTESVFLMEVQRADPGRSVRDLASPAADGYGPQDLRMLAELVHNDPSHDLALLRMYSFSPWPTLALGRDEDIRFGDAVALFGAPGFSGLHPSGPVLMGQMRGRARWDPSFSQWGLDPNMKIYRTSAPGYRGNSGGPLLRPSDGLVLGVFFAIGGDRNPDTETEDDIRYFMSVEHVRNFWESSAAKVAAMERKLSPEYVASIQEKVAEHRRDILEAARRRVRIMIDAPQAPDFGR